MVEEIVSVEEELYSVCEEMENLYKDTIVEFVDDEKVTYIGKKIDKIKKYIHNSELAFELSSDKDKLKNSINAIITAEKTIGQILMDNPNNNQGIRNHLDSIISNIKEIEKILNSFIDISSYLSRDGIKRGIQSYKRGLSKINSSIAELEQRMLSDLQSIQDDEKNKIEGLENIQGEFKTNIDKQLKDFTEKINGLEKIIDDKNLEIENTKENYNKLISDLQESYSNKISEFENNAKQDFDNIKAEIEKKDEKISELIGLIGNKANVGEYKSNADKAHSERIKWQIATVIIFGVAFVLMGLITLFTKDYNITTLARYIVSVILLGMSGYTGKQASNLRKDEVYYRKQQLELSSIDVYLDDIPQDTKVLIKKELSNKIFGQAGETYKNKYDDNTNEVLDKVVKLVENLSNTITKK